MNPPAWSIFEGEAEELYSHLEPLSVRAIVSDPPYSTTSDAAIASSRTQRSPNETQFFAAWLAVHMREWRRVLRPDGAIWLLLDWRGCVVLDDVGRRAGFKRPPSVGVWDKERLGMGALMRRTFETFAVQLADEFPIERGGEPDLWRHPWGSASKRASSHPAEKPVDLMARAVRLVSDAGDLIVDPFTGSGTTGEAAVELGRLFVGFERDPEHAADARRRLAAVEAQGRIA